MSKSSIEALMVQIRTGNIKSNEAHILKFIKERTERGEWIQNGQGSMEKIHHTIMTDLEQHLMCKQSTITSRVSALEDMGVIYPEGTESMNNGPGGESISYSKYYYEPRENKQKENAEKRRTKKFKRVIDHLLKNYPDKLSSKSTDELKKDLARSSANQTSLNFK